MCKGGKLNFKDLNMILNIETTTTISSVAIYNNQKKILSYAELSVEKSHASWLSVMIDNTLNYCQLTMSDICAVAISAGPGSYTGLRIGTATAKGLCYASQIPLISVDTLKSMAVQVSEQIQPIVSSPIVLVPMLDARRMEVYTATYNMEINEVAPVVAKKITADSFSESLEKSKVIFFGDGAGKCKQVLKHPNAIFLSNIMPSAKYIGILSVQQYMDTDFVDLAYFEPFYLKKKFTQSLS